MKKYLLLLISWGVFASVAAQDSLRGRLDSLLCDPMFETSQVGLMVYDLTADSALFTYNHRQLMRPASCMKLVTAITALDQLGANYDYQTRIYMTGNVNYSTLEGNIYCVGGFDPMLTIDDVAVLANCVSRLGIDSIHGLIVADRTMKEALDYGEGWCWDDDAFRVGSLDLILRINPHRIGIVVRCAFYLQDEIQSGGFLDVIQFAFHRSGGEETDAVVVDHECLTAMHTTVGITDGPRQFLIF